MSTPAQFWVQGALVRYTDRWEILIGDTWRAADRDVKTLIREHLSEHCAADDYPSDAAALALRPRDETALRLVQTDAREVTPADWLTRAQDVAAAINATRIGRASLDVDGDHWTLEISTGGWAECEYILGELATDYKRGDLFHMLFWASSHRGGRHVFRSDLGERGRRDC